MRTKLFAFWEYDLFPYLLGSPVAEMLAGGYVRVEGYGGGVFMPVKLLPLDEGKEILAKLEALRAEYREAKKNLHADFMARRNTFAPFNACEY